MGKVYILQSLKKRFNRTIVQFPITIPNTGIFADIFLNGFLSVIFVISLSF